MAMTGFADGPPVRGGGALADFVGGLYLALGVVAALLERERTGRCARARPLEPGRRLRGHRLRRHDLRGHRRAHASASATSTPSRRPTTAFAARDGWVVDRAPPATSSSAASARRSAARSWRRTSASGATAAAPRTAREINAHRRRLGRRARAATRCSPRSGPRRRPAVRARRRPRRSGATIHSCWRAT